MRSFSGLVPSLKSSGISGHHGGPTKHGDALLREALFISADQARRQDPTLAAKYHRLMVVSGKHHNTAICHIAATLLTRIAACWNAGTPYKLRDVDGTPVTVDEARAIIRSRYAIPESLRRARTTTGMSRRRLLEGEVIDDASLFAERLPQWEDHYNYDRPQGALGGKTPYERLRQKARDPLS